MNDNNNDNLFINRHETRVYNLTVKTHSRYIIKTFRSNSFYLNKLRYCTVDCLS